MFIERTLDWMFV
uniref:Uncharacterized protein n=1 Tax=Anguilla anguilla TaxID=7936 RepID=A0A0E9SMC0_ANGAN